MTRGTAGAVFISVRLLVPCLAAGVETARRIVSLSPHLTELVFDAGAGDRLAGAVEYSDYPPEARNIPRVGDAFRIDREMLARVGPDLILAWKGGTPPATVEQLREDGYRVVLIETRNPEQVAAYRGGKKAAIGWFVGQVMKKTAGRANPRVVNELLRKALDADA